MSVGKRIGAMHGGTRAGRNALLGQGSKCAAQGRERQVRSPEGAVPDVTRGDETRRLRGRAAAPPVVMMMATRSELLGTDSGARECRRNVRSAELPRELSRPEGELSSNDNSSPVRCHSVREGWTEDLARAVLQCGREDV